MTTTPIDTKIEILTNNLDAVERFLALYDLYRMAGQQRLSVADALRVSKVMNEIAQQDRDLNVRAWAKYYYERMLGLRPLYPKPFLPKMWKLLLVEEA
jgi:hypothetical protein